MDFSTFPAHILIRDTGELSGLIGAIPGDIEPFFWAAEISSDRLDAYYTHMAESTLRNFANDAAAGVSFLDSHNARNLGYGQSLTGRFEVDGDVSRVVSDFYTVPGIRFRNGPTYESTDDFIRAVTAKLVRDVSVGFYGGDMICDICGNSFYDWWGCDHWPGQEYAISDRGEETITATFAIEDANLAEVSGVYDGATPQAQIIQRAQALADAGRLQMDVAQKLERQYRIKLITGRNWPGVEKLNERSKPMPDENETTAQMQLDQFGEIRALLGEANATGDNPVEKVRWLVAENARLAPLADQGNQYREDLVADALAEGVRAMGEAFPSETYQNMFRSATLDHIKQLRDTWRKQGNERLGGGRKTVDTEENNAPQPARLVPKAAYKS